MAEEGCLYELEGLDKQLQSLLSRYSSDELRADSKAFCSDFSKLVEEHASRWQVPLPQLRILELSLCYFARASTSFTPNCDHVLHTLSSLALSVFELLLFFDQKDFHQEPLKQFTVTFQECHNLALSRHPNVHFLQVACSVQGGGPWAGTALQAILSESSLPQSEVDGCISSELPVFFELRVRYLLSCERVSEAMALAKCCAQHPTAGQHLFFLQVYLTWLCKTSQHDLLRKEVAEFNGKDAIHIICSLECEEKDELLLALSRAFLSQQLRREDMYYLYELVFIWSKLHSRLNTSKQALLEESRQLMLSATNVNSIFPFIRAILQELGEDGIQFCVELCANALGSCLPCDVITKSLIYKTIAGLLPNDLEVCRACALLVFFLERTVETYKMVYLLYMHPDQEYHVEQSPIANHVRFETLQVLKKDLYFDPEFWNLITLRTNCLKLMSEKVVSAALEEIMEDKWILSYCTKEPASRSSTSVCQKGSKEAAAKKQHLKEDRLHKEDAASKRLKVGPGRTRLNVDHTVRKRGRPLKNASSQPLRRSFWQLDRLQDNVAVGYGELRRTTRLSEKNPPKRRIRQPKWLLEDSGSVGENNVLPKIRKYGLRHQKHHRASVIKRPETGELQNNEKHKPLVDSHLRENNSNPQRGCSLDNVKPTASPQVILELSLPDNELMGTFTEDSCNRQRGIPQVLLYRPTVKIPASSQPVKTVHRKEVILRARDATMLLQQMHCYARRQKGKGNVLNIQGSVSTITRSSVQGSPPKDPQKERAVEMKGGIGSQTRAAAENTESPALEKVHQTQTAKAVSRKTVSGRELSVKSAAEMKATNASQTSSEVTEAPVLDKVLQAQSIASAKELCEESAVEMKVTFASTAAKVTQSPGLDKVSKAAKDASKTSAEVKQTSTAVSNQMVVADKTSSVSNMANISNIVATDFTPSQSQDVLRDGKQELKSFSSQAEMCKYQAAPAKAATPEVLTTVSNNISEVDVREVSPSLSKGHAPCANDTREGTSHTPTDQDNINDISALTLVTEMVTELAPEALARDLENHKQPAPEDVASNGSTAGNTSKVPCKSKVPHSCSVVADVQGKEEGAQDICPETPEDSEPQSEESKLEYCCTFCSKDFKGSRVVAHAMFHYRKDECMFCGMKFKDDLLAMMHLSDHIEKLKRIKDSDGNKAQENSVSGTKDIYTPKTSGQAKTANVSSGQRTRGRPRKSTDSPKLVSLPDLTPSGSRQLRSNDKPVDSPSFRDTKQNQSKHLNSKTPVHKVNGHIGKKRGPGRPRKDSLKPEPEQPPSQQISQERPNVGDKNSRMHENKDKKMDSSAASVKAVSSIKNKTKASESLKVLKTTTKQSVKVVEAKNVEPQEKLCCPAEGCAWSTDLSKNRVALLYHALQEHYGEVKPLKLAFRVGNNKCSSCMRVMWSFEHFRHHVERHRLSPRHPCQHRGCTARFKTGMEMRRHARRHSPLQAVCCLPGCSQLFICLWALNLHEREHYASKPTKLDTKVQTGSKNDNMPDGKKQPDHKPKDATTTANKTVSVKAVRKLREATHNSSTRKHFQAPPPPAAVSVSLLKERKESHVLKNLSNKDTSTQSTGPILRLRHTLRKVASTKSEKVTSSSLLKHNIKRRIKFKKKQVQVNSKFPKRRGRPPKLKVPVHDENVTTGQNEQTGVGKTAKRASLPKASETPNVMIESKEEKSQKVQDVVKTTETSVCELRSKKSVNRQVKKNHVKQKSISHDSVTANSFNQLAGKTQKLTADRRRKRHKVKTCSVPKEKSSQTSSTDSKSKEHKVMINKANTNIMKKRPVKKPESASEKPAKSASDDPQVEAKAPAAAPEAEAGVESSANEGKAKEETTDSTQSGSGNTVPAVPAEPPVPAVLTEPAVPAAPTEPAVPAVPAVSAVPTVPANSSDVITAPPTTSREKMQKVTKSKISHVKKEGIRLEKKEQSTASSDSGKTNKKHKDVDEKGDKNTPKGRTLCKDASKTPVSKKKAKTSADQQEKPKAAAAEGSPEEKEGTDAALDSSGSCVPAAAASSSDETTTPQTATEENTQKGETKEISQKPHVTKDPNKAKKRKNVPQEGDTKIVKKKTKVQPKAESSLGEDGRTSMETETISTSSHSVIMNGQAASEDVKSALFLNNLAEYGKKPYMRPPPTAYLDEKYITMPKRRKQVLFQQSLQKSFPSHQSCVTTAPQRHRCANCFATFDSSEELQGHHQLQKCSNVFGFDSDDEGSSLTFPIESK
ncbi:uncharacterized protein LOC121963082 [Plectropomus leopardus]|uniref:uncharacterized protein LOC121963082 n=1 Tax=Plectropomus leopardus TaxID=160734 RepID=UPI001C4BECEA|nr:uncharacterized protein LOC121963082 [Plectropomus leopardus]